MADTVEVPTTQVIQRRTWSKKSTIVSGKMTTAEALVKGGLDFTVEKRPIFTTFEDEKHDITTIPIKDKVAMVRTDTRDVIGHVGSKYKPLQNRDAFSFFDTILASDQAAIEVVGCLGKGEKTYILAKLPDDILVQANDPVNCYLLLYNAHDGTSSIRAKFTPIRPVCFNMLNVAFKGAGAEVNIRHTVNADEKFKEAHKLLGIVANQRKVITNYFQAMAQKVITPPDLQAYLDILFTIPDEEARGATRTKNIRTEVVDLFQKGAGNKGQTLWDLYNGVTEYVDHKRVVKGKGDRWEVSAFGSAVKVKEKAFTAAVRMMPEVTKSMGVEVMSLAS